MIGLNYALISTQDCIEWDRDIGTHGYGVITTNKKKYLAHRVIWEEERGPIPANLCVLHKCDNPTCINIDHLFLGTIADNNHDMTIKRRHWAHNVSTCRRGHSLVPTNRVFRSDRPGKTRCKVCVGLRRRRNG
ncbi:MAG: HNH endonuclease signature motif containing protein [Gammaproteobacteria bacterium]